MPKMQELYGIETNNAANIARATKTAINLSAIPLIGRPEVYVDKKAGGQGTANIVITLVFNSIDFIRSGYFIDTGDAVIFKGCDFTIRNATERMPERTIEMAISKCVLLDNSQEYQQFINNIAMPIFDPELAAENKLREQAGQNPIAVLDL